MNRDYRAGSATEQAGCIASDCMAWRKSGSLFRNAATGALTERDLTGNGQWIDTGHCGLAGVPGLS